MAALHTCNECKAFLPPRASTCPHCGANVSSGLLGRIGRSFFSAAGGGAIAITLMACYGAPYEPPPPDAAVDAATGGRVTCPITEDDHDGDCALAEVDCDDADPTIRPGLVDVIGDEIDQNCDGIDGLAE